MCVLLCGVWSLKKASLKCDKLCWWPLHFNTLHNYTCIMIDKVHLAQKWRDITECKFPPQQAWTWAGFRPIRTIGFDKPPVGRGKSDCWKQRASRKSLSWLSWTWLDSLELGLTLGAWLSWLSLLNISGAALVTLPRHRLNQPSSRRRRIEGTTSKNNELNAYRRKESFLWRHAAASTSLVFSTREHPKKPEPPTWPPRTKTRATHLKETKPTSSLLQQRKQVPLTKSILLIELVKSDLRAVTEHKASVVIFFRSSQALKQLKGLILTLGVLLTKIPYACVCMCVCLSIIS